MSVSVTGTTLADRGLHVGTRVQRAQICKLDDHTSENAVARARSK